MVNTSARLPRLDPERITAGACVRTPVREDEAHDEERVMADRPVDGFRNQVYKLGHSRHNPWDHAVPSQPAIC